MNVLRIGFHGSFAKAGLILALNWNVNSAQLVANTEKKSEFFFCLTTFSSQGLERHWGSGV